MRLRIWYAKLFKRPWTPEMVCWYIEHTNPDLYCTYNPGNGTYTIKDRATGRAVLGAN